MAGKLTAKDDALLRIEYIPLDKIARFDKNPKKHDVGALVTSIRRYGFRDAPIFDGTLKALVAGHGRLKALEAIRGEGGAPPAGIKAAEGGQWLVPVQLGIDAKSASEAKAFLIDHNTLTLSGGDLGVDSMLRLYDQGGLEELLRESGPTVSFDGEDIDELINGKKEVVEDDPSALIDAAKETEKKWGTKLGQLWLLGEHRVLCGDSTKAEDVGRVMGGEKADLVYTDPPYNIASDSKNYAANTSKAMNDLKNAEWDKDFDIVPALNAIMSACAQSVTVYVWTSHFLIQKIWDTLGPWADFTSYCVWAKPNPMPSLSKRHWTWNSELCVYATRGTKRVVNFPEDGHAPSVWSFTKKSDGTHPTQKPLELCAHGINFSSAPGANVLDPFLGSGTTLIAADQLHRKCYGLEISPQYVAVILERWSKATGGEPKLEG